MFDIKSAASIIKYAKELKGKTLRTACDIDFNEYKTKDKGGYGKAVEKYYFQYEPNSNTAPDFQIVGLELKCTPLKVLKNGEYRAKERLVLNIIDYLKVHKEDFSQSSFLKKNAHLLLVFYLHEREKNLLDYLIKLVDDWKYPTQDLIIIKQDWETINQKIKAGKAHEISEGDTFYLGACTKGSTAKKSFRNQPFSKLKAKQRAYALKQGYVNHIIANIAQDEQTVYGRILNKQVTFKDTPSIEEVVNTKFEPFYGKTADEIEKHFDLELNKGAKSYFANLTKIILGISLDKAIEEFEKANIKLKTIRVERNNRIDQSVSFPAFEYEMLYKESWRNSEMKDLIEQKFLFIFLKDNGVNYCLDKVVFWNMPFDDRNEVRSVWLKTKYLIQRGTIFKGYKHDKKGNLRYSSKGKPIQENYFPKLSENPVCHVRPHGRDANDTKPLPVTDKKMNTNEYTKQAFWLNANYVRDEIYLK